MAGLGFKDFQVGEVLTSSDVDGYLMQQTVMRFADAGARGSALGTASGTAVPLAEGMVTYLDDVNDVQFYSGTAWGAIGNVKQIVTATTTTQTSTSSTSYVDTSLSASITPISAENKVFAIASLGNIACDTGTSSNVYVSIFRDAVELAVEARKRGASSSGGDSGGAVLAVLDSPATTSSTTYKVRLKRTGTGATTYVRDRQNLILVEVANV